VAYNLVQEPVEVRATPTTVEIFYKGQRVASYRTMVAQEERYVRWEPIHGLPSNLDTPSLVNDYEGGFRLTLVEERAEGRQFTVAFDQPLAFRCANEIHRLKLIGSLQPQLPWPTFKVENSSWVEWFHDQSSGINREWRVEHLLVRR
jgi:hypothetical protein